MACEGKTGASPALRPAMVDTRFWERGSKDLNYRRGIVNSIILFGGPFNPFSEPARGLSVTGILNYLPLLAFLLMARCASIYVSKQCTFSIYVKALPFWFTLFRFHGKNKPRSADQRTNHTLMFNNMYVFVLTMKISGWWIKRRRHSF